MGLFTNSLDQESLPVTKGVNRGKEQKNTGGTNFTGGNRGHKVGAKDSNRRDCKDTKTLDRKITDRKMEAKSLRAREEFNHGFRRCDRVCR